MAEGNAVKNLQEEITCAVCLDFFRDPVMLLGCGHNFCRGCVARCAQDADGAGSCPQCRLPFPRNGFCPNRQLANVVAAVRELVAAEDLCPRHLRTLCHRDGGFACAACAEHRAHPAAPLEDRKDRQGPPPSSSTAQERFGATPKAPERAAAPVTSAEGTRRALLDANVTLSRCTERRLQPPPPPSPELEEELEDFSLKNNALAEVVKQFKGAPVCSLEEDTGGYQKASVTLDPATAHPQIVVSTDGRSAWRRETPREPLPGSSERFEALRCVLGHQGFAGGRHRWIVEVLPGPNWALGVARKFLPHKGCFGLSPAWGVWAVGQWLGKLRALTWPSPTCLSLTPVPRRIEVALDYGGGRVAFRDADSEVEIFAFPPAAFGGERLRPLLWLGEGPALLTLCP